MKNSNYAFATGKIRFLETKLLSQTDIEKMIDAPSIELSFDALYNTDYADNLSDVPVQEFEKAISEDLEQLKESLVKLIPDKDFLKLLLLEYDFFNLKVIFKEKLFQKNLDHLLINLGFFEKKVLKNLVFDNKKIDGEKELNEIIEQANSMFNDRSDPYKIEFFFDRKYFSLFKHLARRLKNKFIINFVNFRINLINLRLFLRLKKLGMIMPDFLKEALIEEGEIAVEEFIALANQELPFILSHLAKKFPPRFSRYFDDYLARQEFWLLEKRLTEEEIEYLRKAKFIAYGPEIVLAYFYAKRNANKNARLIMNGKLNQIDKLILKERIRKLY